MDIITKIVKTLNVNPTEQWVDNQIDFVFYPTIEDLYGVKLFFSTESIGDDMGQPQRVGSDLFQGSARVTGIRDHCTI